MLNIKFVIKIFLILIFVSTIAFCDGNVVRPTLENYEEIYENLEEADFDYLFGLDPNQTEEYTRYMYSPYPLFRTSVDIVFKSKTIPAGYYLLTPREREGKTWVLFKENGRVSFVIPVYKEESIPENFYEDKLPHEVLNLYEKTRKNTMGFIGKKWGKKNQRTPIPQAYVEFDDKGEWWNMVLYYKLKKYSMLFKKG